MAVDARPGLSSRRFPGAVQELIATGDLPLDTPGLDALERALPESWFMYEALAQRLDQKGWPMRNDVELAHRVGARDPALTARDRALLATVRAWLDGRCDDETLHATWRESAAVEHGSALADPRASDEECAQLFARICPDATDADRRTFLAARRDPVAPSIAPLVVQCAYEARTGWLAYHAHRSLASPSAVFAAGVIRRVVSAGGIAWSEVVELARSLVEREAHRPGAEIIVVSDEIASDWAHALELSLDRRGFVAKGRKLARFPIGDGLPALLGILSHRYDVVVVVIGALGGNHTWMIKESAIRNLYPNVLLAMAPGVPQPSGGGCDWIVPAPPDDELPHHALVERIERMLRR